MKKITLLTLLMWSSLFYGQTYFSEGFEGSFLPTGWADVAGSGTDSGNIWRLSTHGFANPETSVSNFGSQAAFFNDYAGSNNRWLVTPMIDLTGVTGTTEFTYYEMTQYTFYADIGVFYSTDYAGDAQTATWIPINATIGDDGQDAQDSWTLNGPFDLSTLNGNSSVYIGFNYVGNSDSEWYVDDVLLRKAPTCVEPSAGSISNVTATSADFTWTSGPGGTEAAWDVELVDLTAGQTHDLDGVITGITNPPNDHTYAFSSLTPGNLFAAYVRADCGGGDKSEWTGPFNFQTTDDNDECSTAKVIVQDIETNVGSATVVNGSIIGATDSGIAENCGTGGVANDDVWFSFVARTDGVYITIDTPFDGALELFSTTDDTCGTLNFENCADIQGSNAVEQISASGMEAGKTYFARVYQYETSVPANGDFTIKIWSDESLSNDDVEDTVEFKLYPNPVQDKLNLRAQDNIENISVYNMLGQEVLRQAPNKNSSEVDMSALQTGSYFVKVTINGVTETKQIIKR